MFMMLIRLEFSCEAELQRPCTHSYTQVHTLSEEDFPGMDIMKNGPKPLERILWPFFPSYSLENTQSTRTLHSIVEASLTYF